LSISPIAITAQSSRIAAVAEITAMLALVLSYIWGWQRTFRGDELLVVLLYFAVCWMSHLRCRESAHVLGLRLDNWQSAVRQACVPVTVAVVAVLGAGAMLRSRHFQPADLPLDLPWHVAWGTAQQYGLLCLLYRRLLDVIASPRSAALGAGGAFALFHLPNPLLVGVTFVAGSVSCALYRRVPNVYVLGIAHAMISMVLFSALPVSLTHALHVGPGYYTAFEEPPHAP
jgi:membrane protease YdiL (CAAX protease family)